MFEDDSTEDNLHDYPYDLEVDDEEDGPKDGEHWSQWLPDDEEGTEIDL